MKLTKSQLKNIIKEELHLALTEGKRYDEMTEKELLQTMKNPSHWKVYYHAKEQLKKNGYSGEFPDLRNHPAQLSEVEYDEHGPMYAQPVEGETTPDDAEVLVRGYGGLRIDQIRRKLNRMLEESAKGDLRVLSSFINNGVMLALLETLKAHNALDVSEEPSMPLD